MDSVKKCKLCGEPMPEGEEMFFYHGYSGPCPKPPIAMTENIWVAPPKLKVINLFAGPGAGKSTTAAGLFYRMKSEGYRVELVTEFAKEKVYDGHLGCLEDQIYVFAKQQRRLMRLKGSVDIAISDSPLPLSIIYNKSLSETFNRLVWEIFDEYENWNYFIDRKKEYKMYGRTQTEDEAKAIDQGILSLMETRGVERVDGNVALDFILSDVKRRFSNE